MSTNPSDGFQKTISKDNIQNYTDVNLGKRPELVKKIQRMKEHIVKNLCQNLLSNESKIVDPSLIKGIEKEYLKIISHYDNKINPKFNHEHYSQEMKDMFTPQEFPDAYIGDFNALHTHKILETPKQKLITRKKMLEEYKTLGVKDKEELAALRTVLRLLDTNNIKNTKSRTIYVDTKEFAQTNNAFNVQCFFEQDKKGNKHYFSFNELLNDLETFGVESGYPVIDMQTIGTSLPGFHTAQKYIKLALVKNILAKYTNYQEIMMYDFKDYEKHVQENPFLTYSNQKGILAEKVVERNFRNFANLESKYDVTVKKASVGEDQKNKIDLLIQIKDKASGINIQKELQLTVDRDKTVLENKRSQIYKQKNTRNADLDLLELEFHLLDQKVTLWRNMERPIGGLNDLLSLEDKEFLKKTYERIVKELQEKIK